MAHARLDCLPLVHGYAGLGPAFATPTAPRALRGARLLHLSRAGCALLGLDPEEVDPERAAACFGGHEPLPGARPVASAYSGHQFGVWAGQLGDGRALLLGEVQAPGGELWDVQVKGSGVTPYSRMGDGRAVLRSTLREYVAGEALAGLGIPTTRALLVLASDEPVHREETERGALLVRLGRCHVRFGTFEHFAAAGREDLVRVLFGYALRRWFPRLAGRSKRGLAFLLEVAERTGTLVARWMAVGFCHGVMNTDNLSILGETLDHGPYGFLDDFAWEHVSNCSDHEGRYAFARQPEVAAWNLERLAEACASLVPDLSATELAERLKARFGEAFEEAYGEAMAAKLGLAAGAPGLVGFARATLDRLDGSRADYTTFWRALSRAEERDEPPAELELALGGGEAARAWWRDYRGLRREHGAGADWQATGRGMLAVNPKFVARNHLLQEVIAAEEEPGVLRDRLDALLEVLATPCDEHPAHEALARPPVGAERGISVSCSS